MTQNVIVAENLYSEYKNSQVWQVAIQVPSGKRYGRKDIIEPLKALRYMFMLHRQLGFEVSKECVESLKQAYAPIKEAKAAEREAEEKEKLFAIAEDMLEQCASKKEAVAPEVEPAPKKRRGRPHKSESQEVGA